MPDPEDDNTDQSCRRISTPPTHRTPTFAHASHFLTTLWAHAIAGLRHDRSMEWESAPSRCGRWSEPRRPGTRREPAHGTSVRKSVLIATPLHDVWTDVAPQSLVLETPPPPPPLSLGRAKFFLPTREGQESRTGATRTACSTRCKALACVRPSHGPFASLLDKKPGNTAPASRCRGSRCGPSPSSREQAWGGCPRAYPAKQVAKDQL